MTKCPLCGSENAITLFTSTQCVNRSCSNYDASWEAEVLSTDSFEVIRHNAIDIASGGFELPTAFDVELTGQILFYAKHNSYWGIPDNEVFADPDHIPKPVCYSTDGKTGTVHGKCAACPNSKYGSAPDGLKKACRQQIKLYLRLPDYGDDPYIFWVSPLNMTAFLTDFLMGELLVNSKRYPKCVIKLESYPNAANTFRRVRFVYDRDMTKQEQKEYDEYRQLWLDKIKFTHENPKY